MDNQTQSLDPDIQNGSRYVSRKFWVTVVGMVFVLVGAGMTIPWPSFAVNYLAYIGGITGLAGLYFTGSVANKWVHGNASGPIAHAVAAKTAAPEENG